MMNNALGLMEQFLVMALVFLISLGGLAATFYFVLQWFKFKDREENSLSYVLLQIALPRDNEIKIDAAEQFFSSLFSVKNSGWLSFLKSQQHFSFEIVGKKEDIRFYVSVPEKLMDMVEKQIHGAYPEAEIEHADEYNIFSAKGKVAFSELKLKNSSYLPLKIYKDLSVDPLSSITSGLAKMEADEGAAIQLIVSPAGSKWQQQGRGYISKTKSRESDPEKAQYNVDPKIYDQIENKCSKPGFNLTARVVVSSKNRDSAEAHLSNIKGAFSQFNSDQNSFTGKKIWLKRAFMNNFIYRYQPLFGNKTILSTEELATIFHFPNKSVETPHIDWLAAKKTPAPAEIPNQGLYLGKNIFRGTTRKIYISDDDRLRHVYIIGKTGTGKSELLRDMIYQDIMAGRGVAFIDPHDTVEKILKMIPPERAEDVIYFNPSDEARPMGLNMLEAYTEQQKHFVVTSIIGLMYKLYDPYKTGIIGPRFEHAIRNAMLTVMSEKGTTFIEVVRCLTDQKYVQELLPKVQDPIVRRYWTDQIAQTSDFHKSEVLDYIVSKFGRFVTNKMMRNIIGQSESSFDFRKVMDEGKILLINLAKGKIGEENSNFLGLVLVPKILIAAMSRQDIPEEQRRPFYLYVDEFQNFATPDFAQILSEARKFGLALTVANQFIGQMEEEVKNAIFGNVGTLISFRVGVSDANYLQHELQPTISESDLINLERYNVYTKTIVNNEPQTPFSMNLMKDMAQVKNLESPKVAEMVKQLSSLKYGRDSDIIEAEIARRSKL
ncbi:type IV secretion system DNA-binding domain-containing protein [Patescibacteria group bacterium]|nr:type IV secretion system DNA-binding domain-containing protein [Patescibacteria group bacterium]MBU1931529.1 type IV secretion system DNA-binding domain-containing protein [Patescibacteria group bacterium]